jgi:hypothetical protein
LIIWENSKNAVVVMSLRLSFSLKTGSARTRWWLIVGATLGFVLPLLFLGWWVFGGGGEWSQRSALERIVGKDAVVEAERALRSNDFRLFSTGGSLDPRVPGVMGHPERAYGERFGFRGVSLLGGGHPSADERELNAQALQFMAEYNRRVYAGVMERFPNWREEHRLRGR